MSSGEKLVPEGLAKRAAAALVELQAVIGDLLVERIRLVDKLREKPVPEIDFALYPETAGEHVHVRIFAGKAGTTRAMVGLLNLRASEYAALLARLRPSKRSPRSSSRVPVMSPRMAEART